MNMMSQEQIQAVEKRAVQKRMKFIAEILEWLHKQFLFRGVYCPRQVFATQPNITLRVLKASLATISIYIP